MTPHVSLSSLGGYLVPRGYVIWCIALLCAARAVAAQASSGSADLSDEVAEVLALETEIAEAIVGGDVEFVAGVTTEDFRMTHGDAWTRGGEPALVDDKASFLRRVENRLYAVHDYDSVEVEMHGDVAITYGRYVGHIPSSREGRRWFSVWFVKLYAKRDGQWMYLSHRTVDGANYGLSREDVQDR